MTPLGTWTAAPRRNGKWCHSAEVLLKQKLTVHGVLTFAVPGGKEYGRLAPGDIPHTGGEASSGTRRSPCFCGAGKSTVGWHPATSPTHGWRSQQWHPAGSLLLRCGKEHGRLAPGGSVALALPVLCLAYFSERPLLAGRESSANSGVRLS